MFDDDYKVTTRTARAKLAVKNWLIHKIIVETKNIKVKIIFCLSIFSELMMNKETNSVHWKAWNLSGRWSLPLEKGTM